MDARLVVLALLLGAGTVLSCDKSPGSSPLPTPSAGRTGAITIVAPPTIEPGASVQLVANMTRSDGAVENVTSEAQWASTDTGIVRVSPGGLATGVGRGEVVVTATREFRTASAQLMVIPGGTFKLSGRISDEGFDLPGATLTVVSGTGAGLTATTSAAGGYAIYGVAGQVTVSATRPGYLARLETLTVEGHRTLNLGMTIDGSRRNISGRYALTIETAACASRLPEEIRRRDYEAAVEQDDRGLFVRLTGADFVVVNDRGDRFKGTLGPDDAVRFVIGDDFFTYYGYYTTPNPGFVERLNELSTLVINGTVNAKATGTEISGTLSATIGVVARITPPFWPFVMLCHSTEHRFDMRRK